MLLKVSLFKKIIFPHEFMQPSIKMVFGCSLVWLKYKVVITVRPELNLVERRWRRTLIYFYEHDDVRKIEVIKPNTVDS